MTLEDMTDLIRISDSERKLECVIREIMGIEPFDDGSILCELVRVERIIERYSVLYHHQEKANEDYSDSAHWKTLSNTDLSAEDRAVKLLGF